ncbi:MAG: orotidine-5'-phosphate decarboxylase [Deltaproteobacteria bacterium]|nr:orotidine-5'-phosphate decarboxylase [Deltaproteobacteria bacterium]
MVHLAWPFLTSRQSEVRQRLIFALDVASMAEVKEYVSLLKDEVGLFKVGKQLFLHGGPQVVRFIQNKGGEVFLDLKFHDIPRTVARTGVEATRLGVRMFDLHASGSSEMMHQTLVDVNKVCRTENLRRPKILAVTVLTSLNKEDLKRTGVVTGVENQVVRLAKLAQESGMDGVVASPMEIARIRRECGKNLLLVVPGVRSQGEAWDDQKRVLTPEEAMRIGADYLVVGKPIRDAKDPREAARQIVREMEHGLESGRGATRLFRRDSRR